MALDNFLVQDPFGRPFDHPDQLARLETSIEDAFANRTRLADRLKAKPLPRARAEAFEIAPNVIIDNGASNRFTAIEVNARDGPALLNRLAHALDRKSDVQGKRVCVRVNLGWRRIQKKKNKTTT